MCCSHNGPMIRKLGFHYHIIEYKGKAKVQWHDVIYVVHYVTQNELYMMVCARLFSHDGFHILTSV
jgi:hypothetical protein